MAELIKGINDLTTVNPELARQWHPTKNGTLKPTDVTASSEKKSGGYCLMMILQQVSISTLNGKHELIIEIETMEMIVHF